MNELNKHAPIKTKMVRANNAPFMNSTLSKAVTKRSRLKNIFQNKPTKNNELAYKRYRNYCTNLFKREKKKYYENIDTKQITDNKKFWKTVKPLFSEKITEKRSIILVDDNEIISKDKKVADTLNEFFSNSVKPLLPSNDLLHLFVFGGFTAHSFNSCFMDSITLFFFLIGFFLPNPIASL